MKHTCNRCGMVLPDGMASTIGLDYCGQHLPLAERKRDEDLAVIVAMGREETQTNQTLHISIPEGEKRELAWNS